MFFDPRQPDTLLPLLGAYFSGRDLPEPTGVVALRVPYLVGHYRIDHDDEERQPIYLQVRLDDPDGVGLLPALHATRLLDDDGEIPHVRRIVLLGPEVLGAAAMIGNLPPGTNAAASLTPGRAETVFQTIGSVLASLEETPQLAFATGVSVHGFTPERGSWRTEWMARIYRRIHEARVRGTALEAHFGTIVERISELQGALNEVDRWSLVHGRLTPENLTIDRNGAVASITGWHESWIGDSLSAWGSVLSMLPRQLAPVVRGYGLDAARELLEDPAARARFELYHLSHCLQELVDAGSAEQDKIEAPDRINRAARACAVALKYPAPARLAAAIEAEPGPVPVASRPVPHAVNQVRYALEALRFAPSLTAYDEPIWTATMCTALLHGQVVRGEAPAAVSGGWKQVTNRMLSMLPTSARPRPGRPIVDRDVWWRGFAAHIVAEQRGRTEAGTRGSLVATWAALGALDAVNGAVDDSVLRGLQSMVEGCLEKERRAGTAGSIVALASGIPALAATEHLGSRFEIDGHAELAETIAEQLGEAWDVLEIGVPAAGVAPVSDAVIGFADPAAHRNIRTPVAPILLALRQLDAATLPAPKAELVAVLGLTRATAEE